MVPRRRVCFEPVVVIKLLSWFYSRGKLGPSLVGGGIGWAVLKA